MRDTLIVFRKEVREWLSVSETRHSFLAQIGVFLFTFGILWPWVFGRSESVAFSVTFLALLIGNSVVADSFAGERERQTLETLLATRLPDTAIYIGKVLADTCYTMALMLVVLGASVVTTNLVQPGDGFFMYSPLVLLLSVGGAFVLTLLTVGLGVSISLRSKTVRNAQQVQMLLLMVLSLGAGFGLPLIVRGAPVSFSHGVGLAAAQAGPEMTVAALLLAILGVDLAVLAAGVRRFERARLLLD